MNTAKLDSIVAILCNTLSVADAKWLKTGVALALECMDEKPATVPAPSQVKVTFTRELMRNDGMVNYQKIPMIKFLRDLNNLGLGEAKELCERIMGQLGAPEAAYLKPSVTAYSDECRTLESIARTVRSFGFNAELC